MNEISEAIIKAREPLIVDDVSSIHSYFKRILQFDPTSIYELLGDKIKPYQRFNSISMGDVFPYRDDNICACGCNSPLTGRRTRWASEDCSRFSLQIVMILSGRTEFIRRILYQIYEYKCFDCGKTSFEVDRPNPKDYRTPIELEHILPVKLGGGGCWLSNYKFRCVHCHREKTNSDFGWKSKK